MKRTYPSGAQKQKKIKESKTQQESLQKLTSFFKSNTAKESSDEEEVRNVCPPRDATTSACCSSTVSTDLLDNVTATSSEEAAPSAAELAEASPESSQQHDPVCLYNLFSSSVQRWSILQNHVKLTVKSLSTTRWECRIDSVKALRYQMPEVVEALTALSEQATEKKDGETLSSSQSLCKELTTWRFILCVVIWYNVLYQVNRVSKLLQSPSVSIETVKREIDGVKQFLQEYRDGGLASTQIDAREIAEKMQIDMTFPVERQRRTTHQFLYEGTEETQFTPEQRFKKDFFLPLVDMALNSVNERFTQVDPFFSLFGFLYSADNMKKAVQEDTLEESCRNLEQTLRDIDSQALVLEVRAALIAFSGHISSPAEMLDYI
ncbi:Zinc finger MYM-type protein 1 [Acipenser ruthenus]|uniref:Zinc finger MYM-type protein 1 n=1 Tax=Acipenser ruthenus TaxID=7906 RepID=A0A662YS30_ACIRT|nr:Zinc finger MYM-type protein 1 [Acipenser ruthenus]